MKISVIIVTFNGKQYLPELLESLSKTKWPDGEQEIIFVDNASSDGSVDYLTFNLPACAYMFCLDQNRGFAGGNNIGIRNALANKSDYIVLLNQDTVVEPNWIEELIKTARSEPTIGAVQSLLLYWGRKDIINSYGNYLHFLGFGFAGGNLEKLTSNNKHLTTNSREITYASGAAVLYKADALKKVGLLDKALESYHEDSDIGLRLRLAGFKSYLAPKSVVYHKYQFLKNNQQQTTNNKQQRKFNYKYYLMERNRQYTLLKYYKLKTLILIFPAWIAMEIGVTLFAIMRGFWRERLRGYAWIVKNFGLILRKRKEIQTLRQAQSDKVVNDKELMRDFVGWIDFQEIKNPLLTWIGNPVMRGYWRFVKNFLV